MTKDEALKLALEALQNIDRAMPFPVAKLAIKECKAALEAKDEPVAFRLKSETVDYQVTCYCKEQADIYINDMGWKLIEVLYTTPPQRTWVGLTDEEVADIERNSITRRQAIRAIEAKLKEKNHDSH